MLNAWFYFEYSIKYIIFASVKQIKQYIMNEITKKFIELAYKAMQDAYYSETNGIVDLGSESAKKIGDVLQAVGELTRIP